MGWRIVKLFLVILLILVGAEQAAAEEARPTDDGDTILRRMIGQMVLVGFVGNKPRDHGFMTVLDQAAKGKLSGVLYLGRNIRTLGGVKALNDQLQSVAKMPLFIAVDQEGGRIERLTRAVGFKEIPSAAAVAETMTPTEAESVYAVMAAEIASLGFNVNLGPVVDLNLNPSNPVIGGLGRSFSADQRKTAEYGRAFVEGHHKAGVLTALKHFPGHGSSSGDTHKEIVDVSGSWQESELFPYQSLIGSGDVDMIMSAHVINRNIPGAERTPASMSPATLTGLLRKKMEFNGVVISDDLQMGAIANTRNFEDTVVQAVLAGNDVLMFANDKKPDPTIPDRIADLLVQRARENPAIMARIQESYSRIVHLKEKLGSRVLSVKSEHADEK